MLEFVGRASGRGTGRRRMDSYAQENKDKRTSSSRCVCNVSIRLRGASAGPLFSLESCVNKDGRTGLELI